MQPCTVSRCTHRLPHSSTRQRGAQEAISQSGGRRARNSSGDTEALQQNASLFLCHSDRDAARQTPSRHVGGGGGGGGQIPTSSLTCDHFGTSHVALSHPPHGRLSSAARGALVLKRGSRQQQAAGSRGRVNQTRDDRIQAGGRGRNAERGNFSITAHADNKEAGLKGAAQPAACSLQGETLPSPQPSPPELQAGRFHVSHCSAKQTRAQVPATCSCSCRCWGSVSSPQGVTRRTSCSIKTNMTTPGALLGAAQSTLGHNRDR